MIKIEAYAETRLLHQQKRCNSYYILYFIYFRLDLNLENVYKNDINATQLTINTLLQFLK